MGRFVMTRRLRLALRPGLLAVLSASFAAGPASAQIPGLPTAAAPKPSPAASKPAGAVPPAGGEKVVTASGPIKAETRRDPEADAAIDRTLETLLPKYPGVQSVQATVADGVVQLDGRVDDDDTRDQMTAEARQVEGVRMVINRLQTDDEALSAPELVWRKIVGIWGVVAQRWLLAVLALGLVMASAGLARVFNAYSETLLAPFLKNLMLRSIAGSVIGSLMVVGGVIFGLSVLNLTHAVFSVLGVAGLAGLAVGFAFKDITENFIASILLGVRRPFRVGDYVTVAGNSGVVQSLNTRATVLVTLEGKHVRIPNNIIYKEILVNATASPSYRGTFDVVIPYAASTADAVSATSAALRAVDGVLPDPPARALIEELEAGGVRLRMYYWVPVQGVDWFKLNSDAKLRVKVALQQAGVLAGVADAAPAAIGGAVANGHAAPTPTAVAEANLRHDADAADRARAVPIDGHPTPAQHALSENDSRVSEEGTNLLAGSK